MRLWPVRPMAIGTAAVLIDAMQTRKVRAVVAARALRRPRGSLRTVWTVAGRAAALHALVDAHHSVRMALSALRDDRRTMRVVAAGTLLMLARRGGRLLTVTVGTARLERRTVGLVTVDAARMALVHSAGLVLMARAAGDLLSRGLVRHGFAVAGEAVTVLVVGSDAGRACRRPRAMATQAQRRLGALQIEGVRLVAGPARRTLMPRGVMEVRIGARTAVAPGAGSRKRRATPIVRRVAAETASAARPVLRMLRVKPRMTVFTGMAHRTEHIVVVVTTQAAAMLFHAGFAQDADAPMALLGTTDDLGRKESVWTVAGDALGMPRKVRRPGNGGTRLPVASTATLGGGSGLLVVAVAARATLDLNPGLVVAGDLLLIVTALALDAHRRRARVRPMTRPAILVGPLRIMRWDRCNAALRPSVTLLAVDRCRVGSREVVASCALASTALGTCRFVQYERVIRMALHTAPRLGRKVFARHQFVAAIAGDGLVGAGMRQMESSREHALS